MDSKILVDGAVATKVWKETVGGILLFIFGLVPLAVLVMLMVVPWLLSLGHINLVGVLGGVFEKLGDRIFPD